MIVIKEMRWDRAFSYGNNNKIDFSKNPLVQLVGKNGHGKSSIALILEEVIFNKNSKGVKKGDILNRHVKEKSYSIELDFDKDGDSYTIKTTRGASQTVKLLKNGQDISAHTSTSTYKMIEDLWGMPHKSFAQIVYQSSAISLEFLTATDTVRKKFLIDLLNLGMYTTASEVFKAELKTVSKSLEDVEYKIKTYKSMIDKISKEDLSVRTLIEVPENPTDLYNKKAELTESLRTLDSFNKRVIQNNAYKNSLKNIDITPVEAPKGDINALKDSLNTAMIERNRLQNFITSQSKISSKCPTCGQTIATAEHKEQAIAEAKEAIAILEKTMSDIKPDLDKVIAETQAYKQYTTNSAEWERIYSLIDNSLSEQTLDKEKLSKELDAVTKEVNSISAKIADANKHNSAAEAHNAKVKILLEQLAEVKAELVPLDAERSKLLKKQSLLQILTKTFSTNGLVAYKIECLVKELEQLTNVYLQEMSDGRFQLSFEINDSDKLNVVITDNGNSVDISSLSNGEKSRVNVATLLAIRKLLQTMSSNKINLLFLDETVESLDTEGKDKLVEVLVKEEHLNTVLVSHGFQHPLLEKISVVKENNISRIE